MTFQIIGTEIPELIKNRMKIIGTETCSDCNKEYRIIELTDDKGNLKSVSNDCPHCRIERENREFARQAYERRQFLMIEKFHKHSEIPFELEGSTFDDYVPQNQTQQNAKRISQLFANNEYEKTTLFFQGDTGLGKSHLSYCVYQEFADKDGGAIFVDLPSLLANIRNTFNKNTSKTQEEIMKAISDCELLVLDDIGAEYVKPDANGYESWAADILFQIANARQGKKNIYTTNFTSKHLTKKYGMMSKRIISRLMSNAKVIKVEGDDHRLKGLE